MNHPAWKIELVSPTPLPEKNNFDRANEPGGEIIDLTPKLQFGTHTMKLPLGRVDTNVMPPHPIDYVDPLTNLGSYMAFVRGLRVGVNE